MSASHGIDYTDRIARIIDSYALPLPPEVMDRLRVDLHASRPSRHDRFAEEEAAVFLARRLHAMVIADVCAGVGTIAVERLQAAWMRYLHQAEYRADLGLINKVLLHNEIRPLIDDLARIAPLERPAGGRPSRTSATHAPGVPS